MLFKRITHLRNTHFFKERVGQNMRAVELSMEQAILLKPCLG